MTTLDPYIFKTDKLLKGMKIMPECEHCDSPYDVDETGYCYLCRPGFVKSKEVDLETIERANKVIKDAIERIEYTLKYMNK